MAASDRREHERIPIEMPTRMWLQEKYKKREVEFEGFSETKDLAIGGAFLRCDYLLPVGCPINLEMRIDDEGELLSARGEVVHAEVCEDPAESGMGIMFTHLDGENRERLLRFFVSDQIQDFYEKRFLVEFPHLESAFSLKEVALIINLWEDKEERLASLHIEEAPHSRQMRRAEEIEATRRRVGH